MSQQALLEKALDLYTAGSWRQLAQLVSDLPFIVGEDQPIASLLIRALAESPFTTSAGLDHIQLLQQRCLESACWMAMARSCLCLSQEMLLCRNLQQARTAMRRSMQALIASIETSGLPLSEIQREIWMGNADGLLNALHSQHELQIAIHSGAVSQRPIFVLGMHRSGTSAVTGLLAQAGLDAPSDLMPPTEANPKGYWESVGIMQINDRLLKDMDSDWASLDRLPRDWMTTNQAREWRSSLLLCIREIFSGSQHPIIKDPRFCVLIEGLRPWFESSLIQPVFLIPIRQPLEVALSIQKSENLDLSHGLQLWLSHVLRSEHASRGNPRLVIDFQRLIDRPADVLKQCRDFLEANEITTGRQQSDQQLIGFIDPSLRRQRASNSRSDSSRRGEHYAAWLELAEQVYNVLSDSASSEAAWGPQLEPLRQRWLKLST